MDTINIKGAREHNLKNVSVSIPKRKIVVYTGVSGSGKSSLCMDTIAAESRRELNETFPSFVQQYLPKYGRPHVGIIENLPVTMILDQRKPTRSTRSTVGTFTDIQAFLRLLFSRIGKPFVGYSDVFSFNHPIGKCKTCEGLGEITQLDIHKLVDFDKCLNDEGVINFPAFTTGAWRWKRYAYSGLFDLDKKIKDYSKEELKLFLHAPQMKLKKPPSNWPKSAKFEGIYPRMFRSIIHTKEGIRHKKILEPMLIREICPDCEGSRLSSEVRACEIEGKSIVDVVNMGIEEAKNFIASIQEPNIDELRNELIKRLQALLDIGLGYLTLSRSMGTLSGGEAQRVKISKYINSSLTDVVYVLDEPSSGMHAHDLKLLEKAVVKLRDKGNTVMMVEHHPSMIEMADHVIDMGPGAGIHGGMIVYEGTVEGLKSSKTTTGKMLKAGNDFKTIVREPREWFSLNNVTTHNLKGVSIKIPLGVMTTIAGVAGSGKTTLMDAFHNDYEGSVVHISQKSIGANSRSTPGTYMDITDEIRKLFSKVTKQAVKLFSFNSEGACPNCKGKGVVTTEMGFMNPVDHVCEMCEGLRYGDHVLAYKYKNKNIAQVQDMTVLEALDFFEDKKILDKLGHLDSVGLSYLTLNQSMSTLSGGELQRIKLASKLDQKSVVYLMDEPTDGLHLKDVEKLMKLFNRLVDDGNTVLIIDHHMKVIKGSDYLIELGPEGGNKGGYLLYAGEPSKIVDAEASITKQYI